MRVAFLSHMRVAFSVNNIDGLTSDTLLNHKSGSQSFFPILQPISFCLVQLHGILDGMLIIHKPVRKTANKPGVNFLTQIGPVLEVTRRTD